MTIISQPNQRNDQDKDQDQDNKQVSNRQKSRKKSQKNQTKIPRDHLSQNLSAGVPNNKEHRKDTSDDNSGDKRHRASSGQMIDPKDLAMFVTTSFEGHKQIANKLRLPSVSSEAVPPSGSSAESEKSYKSHKIIKTSGFKLDKNYLRRIPRRDPGYPVSAISDSSESHFQKRIDLSSRAAENHHNFKVFQQHLCSGELKNLMTHIAPGERFQFLSHIPYYDDNSINIGEIGGLAFNHRSVYALKWVKLLRTRDSQKWISFIHDGLSESFPFLSNKKIFGMIGFINQDMFDVADDMQPLEYGLSQQMIMLEASPDGKMIDRFMWKGTPLQPIADGTEDPHPYFYEDS